MADDMRPGAAPSGDADDLGAAPTLPAGRGRSPAGPRPERGRPLRKRFGLVPIIALAVIALAVAPSVLSSVRKTPRDKVGISYGGGPFEGSRYQKTVQPGSNLFFNGLFDKLYLYPADQQNYIVSKTKTEGAVAGSDVVTAPTRDLVQVDFQVATFFKLNIDRLRSFHEQLGLKYRAYTSDGWDAMLQDTLRQQIESAIQQETRRYQVAELVGSAEVLDNLQRAVRSTVAEQLVASLGQEYFCGPSYVPDGECDPITFVIKKLEIPATVQDAYNAIQARTNEAKAIDILADALAEAGDDYARIRAIESGKVTFWIIPEGTTVEASPGDAPPIPAAPSEGGSTTTTTQP